MPAERDEEAHLPNLNPRQRGGNGSAAGGLDEFNVMMDRMKEDELHAEI